MTVNTVEGVARRGGALSPAKGQVSSRPALKTPRDAESAMAATRQWLIESQDPRGFWLGELEGDTILESEYVLLMAYLGRHDSDECVKACRYIRSRQSDHGGWAIYPGGPPEISATVKAYFALKLIGVSTADPDMVRARKVILSLGGALRCNSFTRFYLALLGQIPYDDVPSVPAELLMIPAKVPFSVAAMSSWTRTIIVPLMIISSFKPCRPLSPEQGIAELFPADKPPPSRWTKRWISWENFFLAADRGLKWADRLLPSAWRRPGIRAAERWMLEHFENSDGLGAIFPPMVYAIVALGCLGYAEDSDEVRWCHERLDELLIEEAETIRIQPCLSPVWDTAIATIALADAKAADFHPALFRSARWLLEKEVRVASDWQDRWKPIAPSGWHFQFNNEHYPDIDDTAMVLLALRATAMRDDPEVVAATRRGVDWLLALQNSDGGWAAFDKDINNQVFTKVTFADHNAMLDPSCADITARVIELLGTLGYRKDHPAIVRALDYLWKTQEPEGCWYGRWGVNYIYGTWQVLQGLKALDFPMDHPALVRACDWLESVQQESGGWGETCASYEDPSLMGQGNPTASQTAWAVLGLVSGGRAAGTAALRGIDYLLSIQQEDGTWDDADYTGTGFPLVFYMKYHLYAVSFSLMAVARHTAAMNRLAMTTVARPPGAMASRIPAQPRSVEV
ncbi:squalene--hopene cyclase [Tundrisphaera sp. TA3]|uniref:squalene--hopene cyclase n=1 Tax=Tundrisphaera sp. TA3 TaxID=3435775 RepID=UPI003EBB339E